MFYNKENLYIEFDVATQKDTKGKKEKFDNRIQFFKDHIELRKTNQVEKNLLKKYGNGKKNPVE